MLPTAHTPPTGLTRIDGPLMAVSMRMRDSAIPGTLMRPIVLIGHIAPPRTQPTIKVTRQLDPSRMHLIVPGTNTRPGPVGHVPSTHAGSIGAGLISDLASADAKGPPGGGGPHA